MGNRENNYSHFTPENTDIILIDGSEKLLINNKSVSYNGFRKYLKKDNIDIQVYASADPKLFFRVKDALKPSSKKIGTNIKLTALTDK